MQKIFSCSKNFGRVFKLPFSLLNDLKKWRPDCFLPRFFNMSKTRSISQNIYKFSKFPILTINGKSVDGMFGIGTLDGRCRRIP